MPPVSLDGMDEIDDEFPFEMVHDQLSEIILLAKFYPDAV